jgi:hypothetical protein
MKAMRYRALLLILPCLLSASCATVRQKTESYVLSKPLAMAPPIDACLAGIDIMSDNLPLTEDYALITDSLVALASRHGIRLSPTRGDQPYDLDLTIHEHSAANDLDTTYVVMAVLDIRPSSGESRPMVRVVHSAVMRESAVSLYQVAEICERLFTAMEKAVTEAVRAGPPTGAGP